MYRDINAHRSTGEYQSLYAEHHFHRMADPKMVHPERTLIITQAKGMHVFDSEGKRYIDGMSGLWCTAVGYGREELVEAASSQMRELSFYNLFFNTTHPPVINLSEKLFGILPKKYSHVVYTNSGSEANDVLIRTVRRYWDVMGKHEKKIFIARQNGYHGSTVGSASLGGMKFMHEMGDLPIPNIVHIGEPYWYGYNGELTEEEFGLQAAQELETRILALGADNVAAFVAEPFQGAGGMIFPPSTYWPEIQRICRKYDVLLCADEVIGGFGRTGEWFAHQHFGFEPDTITIAKALTSGYVPMGGLVLSKTIAETLKERGGLYAHGLTYQGHPVAAAVALANLKLLQDEGIVDRVKHDTGPYLQKCLRELFTHHPLVGAVQGTGAVASLQFAMNKAEKKRYRKIEDEMVIGGYCVAEALKEGLIVRSVLARIIVAPALIATHADIDEILGKLKRAVDSTAKALKLL